MRGLPSVGGKQEAALNFGFLKGADGEFRSFGLFTHETGQFYRLRVAEKGETGNLAATLPADIHIIAGGAVRFEREAPATEPAKRKMGVRPARGMEGLEVDGHSLFILSSKGLSRQSKWEAGYGNTFTGKCCWAVEPLPSCPKLLEPQQIIFS